MISPERHPDIFLTSSGTPQTSPGSRRRPFASLRFLSAPLARDAETLRMWLPAVRLQRATVREEVPAVVTEGDS